MRTIEFAPSMQMDQDAKRHLKTIDVASTWRMEMLICLIANPWQQSQVSSSTPPGALHATATKRGFVAVTFGAVRKTGVAPIRSLSVHRYFTRQSGDEANTTWNV